MHSIVSAVVLFIETLLECKRGKPAILSIHSEENVHHQSFCRQKEIRFGSNAGLYRNSYGALNSFLML